MNSKSKYSLAMISSHNYRAIIVIIYVERVLCLLFLLSDYSSFFYILYFLHRFYTNILNYLFIMNNANSLLYMSTIKEKIKTNEKIEELNYYYLILHKIE